MYNNLLSCTKSILTDNYPLTKYSYNRIRYNLFDCIFLLIEVDVLIYYVWPLCFENKMLKLTLFLEKLIKTYCQKKINFRSDIFHYTSISKLKWTITLFNFNLQRLQFQWNRAQSYKTFSRLFKRLTLLIWQPK